MKSVRVNNTVSPDLVDSLVAGLDAQALAVASSIPVANLNDCATIALKGLRQIHPTMLPDVTGHDLLWERAFELDIRPNGKRSANGSCELLEVADGWIALNLARPEDWQLMNPWLETDRALGDWEQIRLAVSAYNGTELVERGRLMGLPVSVTRQPSQVSSAAWAAAETRRLPWLRFLPESESADVGLSVAPSKPQLLQGAQVVDLSSLWAGPLCAHLLHQCGAQVTTISSNSRRDGAQWGSPALYRRLHSGHALLELDFASAADLQRLGRYLADADLVIEGSRPRALRGLGVSYDKLDSKPGQVWMAITGYGYGASTGHWVGFGDDVAAAAGLLGDINSGDGFLGDAVADPLAGVFSALAMAAFWARGQGGFLDVSLYDVASYCAYLLQSSSASPGCEEPVSLAGSRCSC